MISKDLLRQVIYDQREVNEGLGVSRQIDSLQIESPEVLVISGVRRCGKSVLFWLRSTKRIILNVQYNRARTSRNIYYT